MEKETKETKKKSSSSGCLVAFCVLVYWPMAFIFWALSGIDEVFVIVLVPLLVSAHYIKKSIGECLKGGSKLKTAMLSLALIANIVAIPVSYYYVTTTAYRRFLPWGVEIHEEKFSEFQDYSYYLKAKVSEETFQDFVSHFKLKLHTAGSQYTDDTTWLSWQGLRAPSFWNPTASLKKTYVYQGGHCWELAKYENGYLYYYAFSH